MSDVVYLVTHPQTGGDVLLRVLEAAQRYIACHADAVAPDGAIPPHSEDLRRSFADLQAAVREMNRRFSQNGGRSALDALAACRDRGPALALMR